MSLLKQLVEKFMGKENGQFVGVADGIEKYDGVNLNSLVVYAPKSLQQLNKVIDCVASGQAIIINFEAIKKKDYQTFSNYLSGAVYAIKANVFQLQNQLYVIAPKSLKLATL